jgi:hypothetical protein
VFSSCFHVSRYDMHHACVCVHYLPFFLAFNVCVCVFIGSSLFGLFDMYCNTTIVGYAACVVL